MTRERAVEIAEKHGHADFMGAPAWSSRSVANAILQAVSEERYEWERIECGEWWSEVWCRDWDGVMHQIRLCRIVESGAVFSDCPCGWRGREIVHADNAAALDADAQLGSNAAVAMAEKEWRVHIGWEVA